MDCRKYEAYRTLRLSSAVLTTMILAACGGGGGGGGGSSDGGGGGNTTKLEPTSYTVYKTGQQASVSGAGAVSSGALSLGAGRGTTLAVTDANTFAMTATNTNYQVVNRRKGAVLMLCDALPSGGKPGDTPAQYVAIATNSAGAETQAVPVTNVSELAGKSFYEMDDCSYVKEDGNFTKEQQNSAPSGATLEFRFDANGNVRSAQDTVDAATITGLLNGTPFVDGRGRNVWFNAYKFTVGGEQKIYFVIRGEPNGTNAGFLTLWTDDPNGDVIGCSLNCAKPADAAVVTSPAQVAGIYVQEYGFGSKASVAWINSSGKYAFGLATSQNTPEYKAGLKLGTLTFDATGRASRSITYSTNGTGEADLWSVDSTHLIRTLVSDPTNHYRVATRVVKDPTNLLLGAWAVSSCGTVTGSTTDPTQTFTLVLLKSGHYMLLDTFGDTSKPSPVPGIEYGTFVQNAATGTVQVTGNLYDTNGGAGLWDATVPASSQVRNYTISADGNTMTLSLDCNATFSRIN